MRKRRQSLLLGIGLLILAASGYAASPFDQPWERHTIDTGLSGGDGVRTADVDRDSDLDLVVGYEESGVVRIYRNPGTAASIDPWLYVSLSGGLGSVEDANLIDLDGDGRHDVVVSTEGGNRSIVVLWAPAAPADYWDAGNWTTMVIPAAAGQQWMFSQALNLDGQNGPDIIAGSKNTGATVSWLKAPANPRIAADWTLHKMTDAGWIMSLEPVDMDGDGDQDFLISDRRLGGDGRGARWLENPGASSPSLSSEWTSHFVAATNSDAMFLDQADIDGDGLIDVILPIKSQRWMIARRLDASGLSWSVETKSIPGSSVFPDGAGTSKAVRVIDIDGDGFLDVAHSFEQAESPKEGMLWLKHPGANPLTDAWQTGFPIAGPEGIKYDLMQAIDLDGDGDLDLITTEENAGAGSVGFGTIWHENPSGDAVDPVDPVDPEEPDDTPSGPGTFHLLAFSEQTYTSDGVNVWQSFDLNVGSGDGQNSNPVEILEAPLVDTSGDGSKGLSFSLSSPEVIAAGYQVAARLTTLDWSAHSFSWFDPTESAQLDVFSTAPGVWSYTFAGFEPSDIVSVEMVFGRDKSGDRAVSVSYLTTGDVMNSAQVGQDGGPQFPVTPYMTGSTSYTLTVQSIGGSWASVPNALALRVWEGSSSLSYAEQWRQDYFGQSENSGDAANATDHDLGGQSNLLERAAGTNPLDPADDVRPIMEVIEVGGTRHPALTFQRLKGGTQTHSNDYTVNGMSYEVELSTSLLPDSWQSDAALFVSAGTQSLTDEVEKATLRLADSLDQTSPPIFLRLVVSEL